jgi:hypothetical protein
MATVMTTSEGSADLATAAYQVYQRYKGWVSFHALRAAVGAYYDSHPELETEPAGIVHSRLRQAAERTARTAKAESAGYHPTDEYFYSLSQVERLLPYAMDPQATPPPTLADELEVNRHHAGKEGYGGWEAAIADIRKAIQHVGTRPGAIQHFLGGPNPHVHA